jgi:phosphonate metabolism protein (transferase hexapeptide repeat family)
MIEFSNTSIYRPKKMLSETPTVADSAQLTDCRLGKFTEVMEHTVMAETAMGDYSYICTYGSVRYAEIYKFSNIAAHVCINPGNHPFERPTLHHFTYRGAQYGFSESNDEVFFNWRRVQKVSIGNDTWIGYGSIIMPGITIGNGSIVGSNSVVTKDVPSYTVVAGSPAKVIRKRFPSMIAMSIESIKWWDWDYETIKSRFEDFKDLRLFLDKYS